MELVGTGLGHYVLWYRAEIPDDSYPGERLEDVVGDIDFPPSEALAGRAGVMVMVIVPSFTEGQNPANRIIARFVWRLKMPFPKHVTNRVDGPRHVMRHKDARQATPNESHQGALPGPSDQRAQCGGYG